MLHNHYDADIIIMKALQFAFSKLWQAITFSYNNTARKIVYGVERDIKMGKNAQGEEGIRCTYF